MAVRLIIQTRAAEGKGVELAKAYPARLLDVQQEPGCEQYEAFQSVLDPDKFVLLERWSDAEALAVHSKLNQTRPPMAAPELRSGTPGEREDYEYNRTR